MDIRSAIEHAKQNIHNRPGAPGRLNGKIAVVTGSARGFGLGIAAAMYEEGAAVVLSDLESQRDRGEEAACAMGDRAFFVAADVSCEASVEALVCACVERFGGLDIFISNAGIVKAGNLEQMSLDEFVAVTRVNYTGYYFCAQYASKIMKAQFEADASRWSDILQINSKSGLVGSKNNFAYAGSKFGGIGLTQSFALELAEYQIKVNAICPGNYYDGPLWSDPENGLFIQYLKAGKIPGAVTTEDVKNHYLSLSPIKRGCTPTDVAKAVFYCVEQCFETGQALPVTGGQVMMN